MNEVQVVVAVAGPRQSRRLGLEHQLLVVAREAQGVIVQLERRVERLRVKIAGDSDAFLLEQSRSMEDYCLFPEALTDAIVASTENLGDIADLQNKQKTLREKLAEPAKGQTLGWRFRKAIEEIFADSTSKVTVARLYAESCRAVDLSKAQVDPERRKRAVALVKRLNAVLKLPETKAADRIVPADAGAEAE